MPAGAAGREERLREALAAFERLRSEGHPDPVREVESRFPGSGEDLRRYLEVEGVLGNLATEPAPPIDPLVGRSFDGFTILAPAGGGGMGHVYRASQETPSRPVAIKLPYGHAASDPVALERFRREIAALCALHHPSLPPVFAGGTVDGIPYYAMAWVEGRSLRAALQEAGERGSATPDARLLDSRTADSWEAAACRLLARVASALAHAHAQGILHRDVKPENILLDSDGEAHLVDFGLARPEGSPTLTRPFEVIGTLAYLAPEQVLPDLGEVGARTDVYALGATLYEALTLRRPFEGETTGALLARISVGRPTPPRRVRPQISADLEAVCLKALARDPADRYGSAEDLAGDLLRCARGERLVAARSARRRRLALPVASGLALLAVLFVALVSMLSPRARLIVLSDADTSVRGRSAEGLEFSLVPNRAARLPPGTYDLQVEGKDLLSLRSRVTLSPGSETRVSAFLLPATPWREERPIEPDLANLLVPGDLDGDGGMEIVVPGFRRIVLYSGKGGGASSVTTGSVVARDLLVVSGAGEEPRALVSLGGSEFDAASSPLTVQVLELRGSSISARPATGPLAVVEALWRGLGALSADGGTFFFTAAAKVFAVDLASGAVRSSTELSCPSAPAPDVVILGASRAGGPERLLIPCGEKALHVLDGAGEEIDVLRNFETDLLPAVFDLDGDGAEEVVLASGGDLRCLSSEGKALWAREGLARGSFAAPPALFVGPDGATLLALADEAGVRALPLSGAARPEAEPSSPWGEGPLPLPERGWRYLVLADLDGDGGPELLVAREEGWEWVAHGREEKWPLPDFARKAKDAADPTFLPSIADVDRDGAVEGVYVTRSIRMEARSFTASSRRAGLGGPVWFGSVGIGDLDGDGRPDLAVASEPGRLHAFRGDSLVPLWAADCGRTEGTPQVLDVDGDGAAEVLLAGVEENLSLFDGRSGRLLWRSGAWTRTEGNPATADVDGDGFLEAFLGTREGTVLAIRIAGPLRGEVVWERSLGGRPLVSTPRVNDLDGDGRDDLLVCGPDETLRRLDARTGAEVWAEDLGTTFASSPCLVDLDGDGIRDVVVGGRSGAGVYVVDGREGNRRATWRFDRAVHSSPAAGDLDGDGRPEIVVGCDDGSVYALALGGEAPLWKFGTGGAVFSSPALHDVDGDLREDVLVGSADGNVYGLRGRDGELLWKLGTRGAVGSSPRTADLDGDGRPEAIFASADGSLYAARPVRAPRFVGEPLRPRGDRRNRGVFF
jgi:serine/threonine protein kinase/outer membrane protein assembly factor BamB